MRVLVVDDHLAIAELYASAIAVDHNVVGIATNGGDALARLRSDAVDCVLLDLHLPDMDGLELIAEINRSHRAVRVVAMTGWDLRELRTRAQANGAVAFVSKFQPFPQVLSALAAVAEGRTYFENFREARQRPPDLRPITDRQMDVLRALASGYHAHEIGEWLGIATETVKDHVEHLRERLQARTQGELIHAAIRAGLLSPLRPGLPPPKGPRT